MDDHRRSTRNTSPTRHRRDVRAAEGATGNFGHGGNWHCPNPRRRVLCFCCRGFNRRAGGRPPPADPPATATCHAVPAVLQSPCDDYHKQGATALPSPQVDWSFSEAPDDPGLANTATPLSPGPSTPTRRLIVTLVSTVAILGLGLWLFLRLGSRDHVARVAVASPSATLIPATATRVEPSAPPPLPSTTSATPSPTVRRTPIPATTTPAATSTSAQTTPIVAPTTSTLEPTTAAGLIAFVIGKDNHNEIYTVHADGSHLVNVSNEPTLAYSPAWAPDGRQLAFISQRTGRGEVFLIRPDGSGLRQVTHSPASTTGVSGFVWSPGGALLAVTYASLSTTDGRVDTAQLVRVDGSATTTLSLPADQLQWSPDGRRLAFDGLDQRRNLALYVARGDGTGPRMIVGSQGEVTGTSESLMGFSWAPDSARLAYITQGPVQGAWPNQQRGGGPSYARIYTIGPDGSNRQLLFSMNPMPDGLIGPSWSPDGRYLLYLIGYSNGGCFTVNLFAVATRKSTELKGVCYLPRTTMPDWSPDGRYLVLSANGIVILNVAVALRYPQDVSGTGLTFGSDLTIDPVWQPLGR